MLLGLYFAQLRKFLTGLMNKKRYERHIKLFHDYDFEMKPSSTGFRDFGDVYVYFSSPRFSKLMERMFGSHGNFFSGYQPRMLRKDQTGCLAMGMPEVDSNRNTIANGGKSVDFDVYIENVTKICSSADLMHFLHNENSFSLAVCIESCWVYLYLAAERGWSQRETHASISDSISHRWHMKNSIDESAVEKFFELYETEI